MSCEMWVWNVRMELERGCGDEGEMENAHHSVVKVSNIPEA